MDGRSFAYAVLLILLAHVVTVSTNYDRTELLPKKRGRLLLRDFNLWQETTAGPINKYDRRTGLHVNLGTGLFLAGPDFFLQRGRYRLTFHLRAFSVDPKDPNVHYDIVRIGRDGRTEFLARGDLDARRLDPAPTVTFETQGGPGHQFLLHVMGHDTKVGLASLELNADELAYWPYFLRMAAFLLLLGLTVWALGKALGRTAPLEARAHTQAHWVAGGLLGLYLLLIFQPFWSLAPSMTGDAPNFAVLADYMARHRTWHLPSIAEVYDEARYLSLLGFRIPDPQNHLHEVAGHVYPHHQYGYPLVLALILAFHRSLAALQVFSALCLAAGGYYLVRILRHTPNGRHAAALTAIMGASAPLVFYSHTLFTESLALPVTAAAFLHLILNRPKPWVRYVSVGLLGLLLFVKFKYIALALPLVAAGIYRESKLCHRIGLALVFALLLGLYEVHVHAATGSFFPLAWYRSGHGSPVRLGLRLKLVFPLLLGYLVDQRFGILLVVPYTWLLLAKLPSRWQLLKCGNLPLWTALLTAGAYLGLNATSGFGGACPALRVQVPVWPLLAYVLFSVRLPLHRRTVRALLAASLLFTLLMLLTGYYTTGYTESYSKFYEAIFPYRFQVYRHLPNLVHLIHRIVPLH